MSTPREIWKAAALRFLNLPRGTPWHEIVRLSALESEAYRAMCAAELVKQSNPKEESHVKADSSVVG